MQSKIMSHKGKTYFYANYTHFGADTTAMQNEMNAVVDFLSKHSGEKLNTLTDFDGTSVTPGSFSLMKDTALRLKPFVNKRAIVGVYGARKTLLDMVNALSGDKSFVAFDNVDKAKDWLVS